MRAEWWQDRLRLRAAREAASQVDMRRGATAAELAVMKRQLDEARSSLQRVHGTSLQQEGRASRAQHQAGQGLLPDWAAGAAAGGSSHVAALTPLDERTTAAGRVVAAGARNGQGERSTALEGVAAAIQSSGPSRPDVAPSPMRRVPSQGHLLAPSAPAAHMPQPRCPPHLLPARQAHQWPGLLRQRLVALLLHMQVLAGTGRTACTGIMGPEKDGPSSSFLWLMA